MNTARPTRRRTASVVLLVGAAVLAAGGTANADSIVYIDHGNVWSSSPDGAHKVRLTDGGDWHSPTQADDGTIAAVRGLGPIRVLAPNGRPLRTITTKPARSGDGGTFAARPVELSFSPDGTKIAYSYVANSCPDGSTCGTIQRATFYTYATTAMATPQSLFGEQFSVSDPEWITNNRTLVFGGYGTGIAIDDLEGGGDSTFTRWVPRPAKDVADGEVSRDGKRLAYVWDYGANASIQFAAVDGDVHTQDPPVSPTPACGTGKDRAFSDPTWSPDGRALAVHDSDGIDVLHFTGFGKNHCETTPSTSLGSGSEPDWGPANPPRARFASAAPATPIHGAATPPGAGPAPGSGSESGWASASDNGRGGAPAAGTRTAVTVRAGTLSRSTLRRGATIRVVVARAGRVSVRVSARRATIATGHATANRPGVVRVRLAKVSKRRLRALHGRREVLVRAVLTTKDHKRLLGSMTLKVR